MEYPNSAEASANDVEECRVVEKTWQYIAEIIIEFIAFVCRRVGIDHLNVDN